MACAIIKKNFKKTKPLIMPTSRASSEIIIFSRKINLLNCFLLAPIIFKIANCLLLFFKKLPTEYKISTKENIIETILAINSMIPMVLPLSTICSAGCMASEEKRKNIKTENTQLKKW
jgi:hypothetical protein